MKRMMPRSPLVVAYQDRYDDPLSALLRPPPGETPEEQITRVERQTEALRISKAIDATLQEDKKAIERKKNAVKLLLLGQSESGKSTTLRNFQLVFAPQHFERERQAWKTVVQLNLIRSLKNLLDVLQDELNGSPPAQPARFGPASPPGARTQWLTDDHRRIRMRLSPLLSIEQTLTRKLLPSEADDRHSTQELRVRAGSGWKGLLSRAVGHASDGVRTTAAKEDEARKDDPTMALAACRDDIVSLWEDPVVQQVLKKSGVRLQDMPGFFLDDAARIAALDYEPTDNDFLRARVRTLGVEEHRFVMEGDKIGPALTGGGEWYIYDVGGSRSLRTSWVPFFDDVQAIIFLAPLAFNMTLEEDPLVNRLEDSISLWKAVCSNTLIQKSTLILFLNKMDILANTLKSGVLVSKYVPTYGDLPNDVPNVVKYFKDRFCAYHRRLSPKNRPFYVHETSVIDSRGTRQILLEVREGLLTKHLIHSDLL